MNPLTIFTDAEKVKTVDNYRVSYIFIFLSSFLITEIGRNIYRPFIYNNNINDFGLADSIGNLGGIIVQIFFGFIVFNPPKNKGIRLIPFYVFGYILYELLQPVLPKGVFDWKDIVGTIIGGLIGLVFFHIIHYIIKKQRIIFRI